MDGALRVRPPAGAPRAAGRTLPLEPALPDRDQPLPEPHPRPGTPGHDRRRTAPRANRLGRGAGSARRGSAVARSPVREAPRVEPDDRRPAPRGRSDPGASGRGGRHLVRYYGASSNATRGKREKAAASAERSSRHEAPEDPAIPDGPHRAALRRRWAGHGLRGPRRTQARFESEVSCP